MGWEWDSSPPGLHVAAREARPGEEKRGKRKRTGPSVSRSPSSVSHAAAASCGTRTVTGSKALCPPSCFAIGGLCHHRRGDRRRHGPPGPGVLPVATRQHPLSSSVPEARFQGAARPAGALSPSGRIYAAAEPTPVHGSGQSGLRLLAEPVPSPRDKSSSVSSSMLLGHSFIKQGAPLPSRDRTLRLSTLPGAAWRGDRQARAGRLEGRAAARKGPFPALQGRADPREPVREKG